MTLDPKLPREAGFTLLELLVSMTILALIFVAALGAIQVGSKSWESGERRAEANQRTRALVDSLARELTMIYPLRIKEQDKDIVAFHGRSDSLTFATFPRSYGTEPFSHMVRIVEYTVAPDAGLVATESYPLAGAAAGYDSLDSRVKRINDQVSDVQFRYLVPEGRPEENLAPVWRDFWDPSQDETFQPAPQRGIASSQGQRTIKGSDRLPLAVELTLTIRREERQGPRELILPPMVFPVYAGRTL
ncbi:MAG: prepilin-type N-terminal cleavage/methylation domain-containing protein [Kofleriaceae bacterium]|nr:prepilin-type N-terminal cleavage/methylation domain-containing protein [Candidatus Methylomirabilis lanthanidiphila]